MGVATVALVYDLTRRLWGRTPASWPGSCSRSRRSPSRSRATTTPMRCSRCAASARCGASCARCRTGAPAGSSSRRVRRPRLRDEDGRRPARRARDRRGVAVGRPARPPHRAAPAAGRRRRDGRRRRRMAAADDAHARVEPPVDLGHERQQHPQPDPQLQRARPPRRPGRRPADRGGGGGRAVGRRSAAPPGPLRLFNEGLGGQAGWLLGFAVVAIVALAVVTRLRRADARTGWLVATGGTFLTIAVAFSFAQGIFHPYYVAQLAPFTAALVGAGSGWFSRATVPRASVRPWRLAAGVATELLVLHNLPGQLTWLPTVLLVAGAVTAVALVAVRGPLRAAVLAAALGLLLLAPASWAVQTLGHATTGTFPAGGPAQVGFGGGPGRAAAPAAASALPPAPERAWPRRPPAPAAASARGRRGPAAAAPAAAWRRRLRRRQRRAEPGRGLRQASTAAAPSPSPASPARRRRSSSRARTSPASAASPAARARSARRGWPTPCAAGACAGC